MERIEGLHKRTGKWLLIAEWDAAEFDHDAVGWLDDIDDNLGKRFSILPGGIRIFTNHFSAFREPA